MAATKDVKCGPSKGRDTQPANYLQRYCLLWCPQNHWILSTRTTLFTFPRKVNRVYVISFIWYEVADRQPQRLPSFLLSPEFVHLSDLFRVKLFFISSIRESSLVDITVFFFYTGITKSQQVMYAILNCLF